MSFIEEVLNDGVVRDVKTKSPSGGDREHYPIALLPQIDVFTDNDYTYEEMKMTNETKKIMEDDSIAVSTTCVHIPVLSASESVYIETKEMAPIEEIKQLLLPSQSAVLEDDIAHQIYPQEAVNAVGSRIHSLDVSART